MVNSELAKMLYEMALLLEMKDVPFKPRAYEHVALSVEGLEEDVKDIYKKGGTKALMAGIPGVGQGIAGFIEEYIKTGRVKEYEKMKKETPVDISGLKAVEGVGPKMIKTLWQKLNVRTREDLERAARAGKIRKLEHFGKKSEEKILKGIEFLKSSGGRRILGHVLPEILTLEKMIQAFPEAERAIVAGSVRRKKETIGDIDILVVSKKPEKIMERFLEIPFILHVYGSGATKTNVKLKNGLDADLRVVPAESFGAALNYFTGSKEHNVALRQIAIKKGYKLNEYGLYKGTKQIAGGSEEGLYKALGLRYIEPELRENTGEIEAARAGKLPELINYGELKGDLQIQTDWTDGENSMEEMAHAAIKEGLEYIAITDHTKTLAMTGGADEKKLTKQMEAIDKLNEKLKKQGHALKVLKGAEVNILKDGTLDIDDKTLAKLDVVGAAVHTHFNLSGEEQTRRIIRAMENPNLDIIFHLSTRLINKREPIEFDSDEIIQAAKRTGTILEIDAYPDRSDIKDEYIKKCVKAGVKMSIDSDAHATAHIKFLENGISQARRGWARKGDIVNAWPLQKLLSFLIKNKKRP
ncbi:MAG: DNA polymerase III [Candidatus Sungbacteria bacterium RIFCSPLOWO2_01_FULL_47_32]|uniref:DNA-directed DNA polymerase n=1 Tax=Candidatus Sungbacteria bacterium RIFCSPHIGHO2_01_FULL_47_32 TaxID=1802264 RepID=A0A1G2K234_9BACT|nr:MAG: PHP domain protein [Parcubacteria group bacterium GW2011_GWA2_47_10]OGZ93445.1 MAG: DNA polymerase III [Candidatus Sungbacteria bacterium RIFCSPHIGHO2_01_FULL_47_32]OGZ99805.1 MAG: DNA polymerase III [Candidatus Sungbacteria bacterium RIFCSPHIGHO2_02_FULL_46_12]OHA05020.1 MAG: DNA polymerase III [Candidatus Sungbacteria bacterium RIFCSPLOWO2_01_FULL_47_32]